MAKKQANLNETAASMPLPRAAKTPAPRVKAAHHSRLTSADPVAVNTGSEQTGAQNIPFENASAAIERIAYSYWEGRGFQGGNALEDWVRAENEYTQRAAVTRV